MPYDVFLSYAHGEDGLAPSLHDALQRFAKPWWRRRALRVFLDRTALSANPGLWSSIAEAMDDAGWMVLVASPAASASTWVNNEITYWLERHGVARLLIVLADGDLRWDPARADFDPDSSAVPPALRGAFTEEPRHVDFRWAGGDHQLDLHNPRFRDHIAELAAPIRGLSKDEIEGTDLREHRRFRRTVAVAASVLALLAMTATIASLWAMRSAQRASARTADADFARLVAQARLVRTSNPTLAMLLAVQATHIRDDAQAESALLATLSDDPGFDGEIVDRPPGSAFTGVCLTDDGRVAVAGSNDGAVIIDVDRAIVVGSPIRFGPSHSGSFSVACSRNGSTVLAFDKAGYWKRLDVDRHITVGPMHHDRNLYDLAVSPSGHMAAASDYSGHVTISSVGSTGAGYTFDVGDSHAIDLQFSPDGASLATVNSGHVALWTVDGLRVRWQVTPPALAAISATPRTPLLSVTRDVGHADFSPDGRTLAVSSGSQLELIDVGTGSVRWARPTAWYDGSQVGFSGDGRLLANLSAGEIQQVSTTDGAPIGEPLAPQGGISVDFAISGTRIVASSNASPILSVFNLDPNGPLSRTVPDADSSQLLEYDPTGRSLLLLLQAGSGPIFAVTRTFDQRTGSFGPVLPLLAQPRFLEANSVGGMQASFTIGEFDSRTARPVAPSIAVPILHLTNAQFDPRTHRILIANTTGTLDLFSPKGRSLASPWANLGGYPVLSSSGFARNGSIAAFDSNTRSVWVLNSRGRKILHESIDVTMAALSPQGDRLAVLHDQQVDLFDVHTGARIGGAVGVPAGSTDLEFSEDGKRMLVFGQNQGVIVDLGDEQLLGDPFSSVGYLALRPDGDQLATMSDGWITLWNLNSRTWPSAACHAAGRNLTHAEWNYYLPDAGAYGRTCPQWPSGA